MGPDVESTGGSGSTDVPARIWNWLTTNRYTRHLEAEVERLRADRDQARRQIWALVNSLVTTAGAPLPQEILRQTAVEPTAAGQKDRQATHRGRKSWHQRALALEIENARELQRLFHKRGEGRATKEAGGVTSEAART